MGVVSPRHVAVRYMEGAAQASEAGAEARSETGDRVVHFQMLTGAGVAASIQCTAELCRVSLLAGRTTNGYCESCTAQCPHVKMPRLFSKHVKATMNLHYDCTRCLQTSP